MEAERPYKTSLASVGTSGFSYRDWKGVLYPEWMPARDWFHYYATRFNAVEINLTFYRPPTAKMLERWQESVPPGFAFVLKASQLITHQRRLANCGEDLERMVAGYAPLGRNSPASCSSFRHRSGETTSGLGSSSISLRRTSSARLFRLASRLSSAMRPGIQARHWICWPGTAAPWCFTT